ncbi:hypothetical protein BBP40_004963 [Aspergillus hancockii]|nr:hypothetical protein BBP40_004963 [Aspergillus hancockii]
MAEETQVLSIQQRIAALKQAQAEQSDHDTATTNTRSEIEGASSVANSKSVNRITASATTTKTIRVQPERVQGVSGLGCLLFNNYKRGKDYNSINHFYRLWKRSQRSPLPPVSATGHAWTAVRIDNGQWKLLDACWGAGAVQGAGLPYKKQFNPAMFTDSNDEFGLRHFPSNRAHFYRDDGRPEITWQEYILGDPNSPLSAEQPTIFGDAKKHSLGERSFRPAAKQISIHQPGPLRFQFNLICEHWTLQNHTRAKPGLFLLMVHGVDGRQEDRIPFTHVRGSGPGGGGDCWYVDLPNAKVLGAPGQKLAIAVLTSFGDRNDARGVTAEEYRQQVGRVGMAWAYIAEWQLV